MIQIENLSKTFRIHKKQPGFRGSLKSILWRQWVDKSALTDFSIDVPEGSILGLLGANGAGKTTLVKILTGIIHPTGGTVSVMGFNPWARKNEYREQISLIMGQKAQLWWDLPAADCFLLLKEIYQIPEKTFYERQHFLAETLGVKHLLTTQIRRLSLGERMKMELVAALLHGPKVIFLDEPTIGLDLASQRSLRKFLRTYHAEHKPTIIVTSHYMEDIEYLCQRICIMREGRLVYDGQLDQLVREFAPHKYLTVTFDSASGEARRPNGNVIAPEWGEVESQDTNQMRIRVKREFVPQVSSSLLTNFPVADLNIGEPDVGAIVEMIQSEGRQ